MLGESWTLLSKALGVVVYGGRQSRFSGTDPELQLKVKGLGGGCRIFIHASLRGLKTPKEVWTGSSVRFLFIQCSDIQS